MVFLPLALVAASIVFISQAQSANAASSDSTTNTHSTNSHSSVSVSTATNAATNAATKAAIKAATRVSTGISAEGTGMQAQYAKDDSKAPTMYTLDFNSADHCIGDIVGQFEGTAADETCQQTFGSANDSNVQIGASTGNTFNVFVHVKQPASGPDNSAVAFYAAPGCDTLIALTNQETCIGTGNWTSFKLIYMDRNEDIQWFESQEGDEVVIPVKGVHETMVASASAHLPLEDPNAPNKATLSSSSMSSGTSVSSGSMTTMTTGSSTGSVATGSAPLTTGCMVNVISDGQIQAPICTTAPTVSTATAATSTGSSSSMSSATSSTGSTNKKRKAVAAPIPAPAQIEHMVSGKKMEHGDIKRSFDGEVYKFHQVAKRVWTGVPLHEWDEKIHKRSDIDLSLPVSRIRRRSVSAQRDDASPGFSKRTYSTLEARVIPNDRCNLVRTCLVDNGDGGTFNIDSNGEALLSAIDNMNSPADDDFYFLWINQLVVEIIDEAGAIQGYIYAHSQYNNNRSHQCSSDNTQRGTVASALAQGAAGTMATDMRVDLVTTDTDSLWISTRAITNKDDNIYVLCQAVAIHY